ncbi:rhomboid family intramembrane serine protease [Spirulina subsalsa FACHB-351]|uniref:Rhomboid family intramembrane serine protease n=1 Tax=Spirulina subsalsa FACHB-351 TaxID=234711 RepID=A0ABT3LAH7_9CYAN|nr:rhomboid family intramembrane serine protease [Spirulina subsalsa]MCW6038501.1 rhomboid family intramembrane serine protease [Spirulina subsalsa FACHB-351]
MKESLPESSEVMSCPVCEQWINRNVSACPHCGCIFWHDEPTTSERWLTHQRFIAIAIGGCTILYIATLILSGSNIGGTGMMNFLAPNTVALVLFGATGAIPVFELGRWWTVLSAAWLHGSLLHIVFNMLWVRDLGAGVGQVYGASRLVVIYTCAAITGAFLSSVAGVYLLDAPALFHGAQLSVGASGAIFGLFGALVSYGQKMRNPNLRRKALSYAVVLFVFGVIMPNVDNWGHLGGFLGGYILTQLPGFHPEDRWGRWGEGIAIACLLLTLASVIVSVLDILVWR